MIHIICVTKDEDGYDTLHNASKKNAAFSGKEEAMSYISDGNAVPVQVIGISKRVSEQRK